MRNFDIRKQADLRVLHGFPLARREGSPTRPKPLAHALRGLLLLSGRICEGLVILFTGLAAPLVAGGEEPVPLALLAVVLAVTHGWAVSGIYEVEVTYGDRRRLAIAVAVILVVLPLSAWATARLGGWVLPPLLPWTGLAVVGILVVRPVIGWVLRRLSRWGQVTRRVLVVGDRDRALEALSLIAGDQSRWAFPVGVCLDRDAPAKPILGGFISGLADVERVVREEAVDDVIVAVPWKETSRLAECLAILKPLTIDVHLFPETPEPFMDGRGLSVLAGVPMARIETRPLSGGRAIAKEIEDRLLGALLLLLISPLIALVAVLIRLDSPGPVFFRQSRYGYDNQPFTCLKFRSMVVRPEEDLVRQATRDDPRVTRVGKFLRSTSLDELPQLINVVGGTMSLVGPRPHAVSHHHQYAQVVDDYRCRHRMKPGITGWAQVNGYRGETATLDLMSQRVVCDLWYIDHWSLWLDLVILMKTPGACLGRRNAY